MDALPPSEAARFRDLERRIEILERSNKLLTSTITGGQLRILDDTGVPIMVIGRLTSTKDGFTVYQVDGVTKLMQVDNVAGFGAPWFESYWRPYENTDMTHNVEGYGEVINSTFRKFWRSTQELLFSEHMLFRVIVTCPVGTTGELRVFNNSTSTQLGSTLSVPAGTSAATYEFRLAHGLGLNTGPHNIYLEGRVTSGAGALRTYLPGGIHWGSNMAPVAGGWVP